MGLFNAIREAAAAFTEGLKPQSQNSTQDWTLEDTLNFEPYFNQHINHNIESMHQHKEYEAICAMNIDQLKLEYDHQMVEDRIRPEDKGNNMWWVKMKTMLVMQNQRKMEGQTYKDPRNGGQQLTALDYLEAAGDGIIKGQLLSDALKQEGIFKR